MPPKFGLGLALQVPDRSPECNDERQAADAVRDLRVCLDEDHPSACCNCYRRPVSITSSFLQENWEVGTNGSVSMLTKSFTPYQFSSEGLIKAAGPEQLHYRVRLHHRLPLGDPCWFNNLLARNGVYHCSILSVHTVRHGQRLMPAWLSNTGACT